MINRAFRKYKKSFSLLWILLHHHLQAAIYSYFRKKSKTSFSRGFGPPVTAMPPVMPGMMPSAVPPIPTPSVFNPPQPAQKEEEPWHGGHDYKAERSETGESSKHDSAGYGNVRAVENIYIYILEKIVSINQSIKLTDHRKMSRDK